jgi:hypothetical protein
MNKDLLMSRKLFEKWEETPNLGIKRKSGDDLSEGSEVPVSSAITVKNKQFDLTKVFKLKYGVELLFL